MSLGALDFGILVDGAVIVVESTLLMLGQRRADESGVSVEPRIDTGVREVAPPVSRGQDGAAHALVGLAHRHLDGVRTAVRAHAHAVSTQRVGRSHRRRETRRAAAYDHQFLHVRHDTASHARWEQIEGHGNRNGLARPEMSDRENPTWGFLGRTEDERAFQAAELSWHSICAHDIRSPLRPSMP